MDKFNLVFFIILISLILDTWAEFNSPKIFPKYDEVVFESKWELTLGCVGIEPVTWTIPNSVSKGKYSIQPVNMSREKVMDSKYLFGSLLTINKASVSDIGYYTCHDSMTHKDNPTRAKKIYVYVKDDYQLFVPQENWILKYFIHLNLTLPCIPTSPDVSVILMQRRNQTFYEVPANFAKYNPHLGFSLKISEMESPNQIYKCIFQRNSSQQIKILQSDAQGVDNFQRPFIDIPDKYVLKYIGEDLELRCSVIVEEGSIFKLKWEVPNNSTNRLNIENYPNIPIKNNKLLLTKLTIKNLTTEDDGMYSCYIAPDYKEDIFHKIFVTIAEKNSHNGLPKIYSATINTKTLIFPGQNSNSIFITINSNDDLILNCQSETNITWSYPKPENIPDLDEQVSIKHTISNENKVKIYYSAIFLKRSHYLNGGFFYCHEIGAEKDDPYKASKIYVFIRDKENIVLYPIEKEHYIYQSSSYYFWIPCLPTSPDVVVTVNNYILKEYDPRFGFKVNMTDINNEGLDDITCNFKRGDYLDQRFVYINLDRNFNYAFQPNIIAPINEVIFTTEKLLLTCTIVVNNMKNYSVVWNTPNRNKTKEKIFNTFIPTPNGKVLISTLTIPNIEKNDKGFYKCFVENDKSSNVYIRVKPIFDVQPFIEAPPITLGETLIMHCNVLIDHNIQFNLQWNHFITNDSRISTTNVQYIPQINKTLGTITLTIKNVTINDQRNYSCSVIDYKNNSNSISIYIFLQDPLQPIIFESNMDNTKLFLEMGDPFTLTCFAKAMPKPKIKWTKDNILINERDPHLKISYNKMKLEVDYAKLYDGGVYICNASNFLSSDVKIKYIYIQTNQPMIVIYTIIIMAIIIFMIIFFMLFAIKLQKMKNFRKRIKMLQFQKIENINPDEIEIIEPELLQYDKKWELPRNKIKLRERIGSGNFGLIMKTELIGKTRKTVAVKMTKNCFDYTQVELFFSELKIMTYVGKHLNVINLIGACTENITNGELLIVVEYCKFGNLRNYLLENRDNYIDLINMEDKLINDNAVYVKIVDSSVTNNFHANYNVDPTLKHVYDMDSEQNQITTNDLIFWSFQIARGMKFLASKKIMHGDLAARNILLSENNIIKICDFGLSKKLFRSKYYKKKNQTPLPIKWMAIESIRDGIFSTKSDVWSFGIVLWELFSLARSPYPDLLVDSEFSKKLNDGYRMKQPEYASIEIYQIMLNCWHEKPSSRPSFTKLITVLEDLVDEDTLKFYAELTESFEKIDEEV